jgi:hypothetical protein
MDYHIWVIRRAQFPHRKERKAEVQILPYSSRRRVVGPSAKWASNSSEPW